MIFITVGSRNFQFDRLLKAIDDAIEQDDINDTVFAQTGTSKYHVRNYETTDFLNHEEFSNNLKNCDVVLTHGGTGVIVNAVKLGKSVVAVPRLKKYEEAVDDHQLQLIKAFEKKNMVIGCYDCKNISEAIEKAKLKEHTIFESNTQTIIDSIESFMLESKG